MGQLFKLRKTIERFRLWFGLFLRVLNIKYSRYSRRQNVIIVIISFWNMKWMSQRGISLVLIWSLFPLWLKRRTHAAAQLYILIYGSWISADSLFKIWRRENLGQNIFQLAAPKGFSNYENTDRIRNKIQAAKLYIIVLVYT